MVFMKEEWLTDRIINETLSLRKELELGRSADEVAMSIYMSGVGSNESRARIMVSTIKRIIDEYHCEVENKADDIDFIKQKLDSIVESINTPTERCKAYYKILVALDAYAIRCRETDNAEKDAEDFLRKNSVFKCPPETNPENYEDELRNGIIDWFENVGFAVPAMSILNDVVTLSEDEENMKSTVAGFGRESADLKLIIATQVYINYINGEYKGKEVPLSMDGIVYAVCAGIDYNSIASEPTGKEKILDRLCDILLCANLILMISVTSVFLFMGLNAIFGLAWGIAIFVSLIAALFIYDANNDYEVYELIKNLGLSVGKIVKSALEGIYNLINLIADKSKEGLKNAGIAILKLFNHSPNSETASEVTDDSDKEENEIETEVKIIEADYNMEKSKAKA